MVDFSVVSCKDAKETDDKHLFFFLPLSGACFKGYHLPLLFSLGMKSSVKVTVWDFFQFFCISSIKNVTACLLIHGNYCIYLLGSLQ